MSLFTSPEHQKYERLMKEVPGFDSLKVRPEDANVDCYRCDQFDRELPDGISPAYDGLVITD